MAIVQTTKGLVPYGNLEVKDLSSVEGNIRTTATEWYLEGELVRRDLNINILSGQDVLGTQEGI